MPDSARAVRRNSTDPRKERQSDMKNLIARFVREDAGQDLIEYALLLGIISLTLVTVLPSIGAKVLAIFQAFDAAL
jgi:Flp pilus assembly pilin Flp